MMGQSVFSIIIDGIMGSFKHLGSSFSALTGSLGGFREVIVGIRKFMLSFATQTFG